MNAFLRRIIARLAMPESATDEASELRALRSHPRRLLYIAGVLLSLLLLAALATAVALHVRSYQQDRLQGFIRAHAALEAQLTRHDASYARLVNMTEYAWQHRMDSDPDVLDADARSYLLGGEQLLVQQGSSAAPQVVLGLGTERWPRERLRRYLALSRSMSTISRMAFNGPDAEAAGAAYFLDPSGQLVVMNEGLKDSGLQVAMASKERDGLFTQLRAFANLLPPASAGDTVAALRPSGIGPRIGFAAHPVSGRASLVTAFPAHDGTRSLGLFVAFEPTEGLAGVLRDASDSNLLVVAPNGQVILGSRGAADVQLAGALHDAGLWLPGRAPVTQYRRDGRFVIGALVAGTDWSLATTYDWRDMLVAGWRVLGLALAVWAGLLSGVWLLLAWVDRRVLAPAARRAGRVYANEQLFRSLIQMTPAGLCLLDVEQAVPVVQNELARRYARSAEQSGLLLYTALVRLHAAAAPGPEEHQDIREFELSHPDASTAVGRHLLVRATQVVYQSRTVLLCALQDLTSRVELQEQSDRLREDAEAANRAKSRFLAAMSHEIRTPLQGILGHLELFGRSQLDSEQHTRLQRINQSAESLLLIINDVLDLERMEAGMLDVSVAPFEPAALLERVALLYAPLAQGKGVDLDIAVDDGLAAQYSGALQRIEQVLRNLVSNAIKFTPSGRIEIRVMRSAQAGCLRLEVADSGIGLTLHQQDHLFEPFVQADATVSTHFGGSGLGLSLCRQLCRLMGGDIDVHSTIGVGSVFGFDVVAPPCVADAATDDVPLQGCRVLLYSEVPSWRDELVRRLRSWGAEALVLEAMTQADRVDDTADLPLIVFERNHRGVGERPPGHFERVVRVRADGPLHAVQRQGAWWVSCYSASSLLDALQEGRAARRAIVATTATIG